MRWCTARRVSYELIPRGAQNDGGAWMPRIEPRELVPRGAQDESEVGSAEIELRSIGDTWSPATGVGR